MPKLISIREDDFGTTLLEAEAEAEARTFYPQVPALLESIAVPSLTDIGMEGLRRHGPNLKKLEIHRFPRLRSLKIWFELDLSGLRNIVRPCVTFSEAGKIFKYLRERAVPNGSRLRELEIVSGLLPSSGSGHFTQQVCSYSKSAGFKCLLSEWDDEASRGVFSVRCLQLSAEENERLHKLEEMDGTASPTDPVVAGPVSPVFNRARYGPDRDKRL
ncbi:hypothetical protein DL769_009025 [Monosporascus sp. CRB-8-3]|nr:hypothetical protein DL769_009025 [Monosporascus sp. CRB-8-3]